MTGTVVLQATTRAAIERARSRYPHPRSAVLPALWAVQEQFGYLPGEALSEVAELLGLVPGEVEAVATFYSMYFTRPLGRHQIAVCVNVACALRGADEIAAHLERRLGCPSGSTTADGSFTWQATIECLGACGYAPMMQVDHYFYERLTPEKVDAILEQVAQQPAPWESSRAPEPAPSSAAGGGPTSADSPTVSPASAAESAPRQRPRATRPGSAAAARRSRRRRPDTRST